MEQIVNLVDAAQFWYGIPFDLSRIIPPSLYRPHTNCGGALKLIKSSISDEYSFSWRNAETFARQIVDFRIGFHIAYLRRCCMKAVLGS